VEGTARVSAGYPMGVAAGRGGLGGHAGGAEEGSGWRGGLGGAGRMKAAGVVAAAGRGKHQVTATARSKCYYY